MLLLYNKKGREMYEKMCCTIRPFSLPLPLRITLFFVYCVLFFDGVTYKYINESFAFIPGCMGKELLMHLVNKNEDFLGPLQN